MNEHYVINLGRQLGSGGKEIGEKLAKALNIAFYDKELIQLASDESGLCKEFFEKADERAQQTMLGGLFGGRFQFISDGTIPYDSERCNSPTSRKPIVPVRWAMCRLYPSRPSSPCKHFHFGIQGSTPRTLDEAT